MNNFDTNGHICRIRAGRWRETNLEGPKGHLQGVYFDHTAMSYIYYLSSLTALRLHVSSIMLYLIASIYLNDALFSEASLKTT